MKRQGDLVITKVDSIPKGAKAHSLVLVLGEATGHAHRLEGASVFEKDSILYLRVAKQAKLLHEEHKTLTFGKGNYSVIRQREYAGKDMTKLVID